MIKPLALVSHPMNLAKFEAAQQFCTLHGLEYRVMTEQDLKLLTFEQFEAMTDVEWNKGAHEYLQNSCHGRARLSWERNAVEAASSSADEGGSPRPSHRGAHKDVPYHTRPDLQDATQWVGA
jgi:hypothetical protein